MTDDYDYGFFCDLETAKTMEYEKVEYYVVKVSTKYEVRKKPIELGEKPPNRICISKLAENSSSSCCCIDINHSSATDTTTSYLHSTIAFLTRLPRNVYYSFTVCTVTATCVYMTMTITNT